MIKYYCDECNKLIKESIYHKNKSYVLTSEISDDYIICKKCYEATKDTTKQ